MRSHPTVSDFRKTEALATHYPTLADLGVEFHHYGTGAILATVELQDGTNVNLLFDPSTERWKATVLLGRIPNLPRAREYGHLEGDHFVVEGGTDAEELFRIVQELL